MNDDFKQIVKFQQGYDYRDDLNDKRGAGGLTMWLCLRGPEGAVTARIETGWMLRPLTETLIRSRPPARRDRPGLDAGLALDYPSGAYVGYHRPWLPKDGSVELTHRHCEWLDGQPCEGDGSYTIADEVLEALVLGGDDGVWGKLSELYDGWLSPAEVSE